VFNHPLKRILISAQFHYNRQVVSSARLGARLIAFSRVPPAGMRKLDYGFRGVGRCEHVGGSPGDAASAVTLFAARVGACRERRWAPDIWLRLVVPRCDHEV
jgi:hypothetical protein